MPQKCVGKLKCRRKKCLGSRFSEILRSCKVDFVKSTMPFRPITFPPTQGPTRGPHLTAYLPRRFRKAETRPKDPRSICGGNAKQAPVFQLLPAIYLDEKMASGQVMMTRPSPATVPPPGGAPGLRPSSRGVVFSPRPLLNTGRTNPRSWRSSSVSASRSFPLPGNIISSPSSAPLAANPRLTSIEIENAIKQKVAENTDAMKRAFQLYDAERCSNVTKGEFRRVVENYAVPLTADQLKALIAKVGMNPNGTICYTRFLNIFSRKTFTPPGIGVSKTGGAMTQSMSNDASKFADLSRKFLVTKAAPDQSVDSIERHLQQKIGENLKHVIKAFRLFDYNRDGRVQRHELRRVLENYCIRLSDAQYDKLWSRYDQQHTGAIDYRDFLRKLGVNVVASQRQLLTRPEEDLEEAPWDAKKKRLEREKDVTDLVLNRNKSQKKRKSRWVEDKSFAAIEKQFRRNMQINHQNIKRAMMTFDLSNDGFIAIDDLKAVLDNFVLPTTEEIFHQLMYKFEVRGTGKVSWEQFLGKFQDPQSVGNGQTLPIGQNHKVNPTRQGMEEVTTPEILTKLKKHVLNNYATLKQAFLAFDENRKGVITRSDLRRIVETFTLKLSDDNFKQLLIQLDPEHTGLIRYHNFLEFFEPKESVSAHKWLHSTHRFNQNQPPAILAWDTVEEILRVKLSENYKLVADEFVAHDTVGDGTISRAHLRRLTDRYALPVSDEHFDKMWKECEEPPSSRGVEGKVRGGGASRIMFAKFLDRLGIDVKPGDLEGMSTRIHDESNFREVQRKTDQSDRIGEIDKVDLFHTRIFTAKEVGAKIKDRMAQHDTGIRKSFLRYSRSGKGFVTKKDFRKMLEDMGFRMEATHFKELVSSLNFSGRGLSYSDFISSFQDLRTFEVGQKLERAGNHTVNPTNVKYMSAAECYELLIERMRQNFGSVRSAFYKVDDDHDGVLTMHEFRKLLDSFMFIITDETFHQLLSMLGLSRRSSLSYHDFLAKFEIVDKEEGHPWLKSEHRFNKVRSSVELAADQVHDYLAIKAEQTWSDLAKAFQNFDADGNGIIKKKELRSILYRFILPISNVEFQKLWSRYDEEGKGFITHQDFLNKLGIGFAPGDNLGLQGTSRKMVEENYMNVLAHHELQQAKHQEISINQAKYSRRLDAETVERELKDRFREYYSDFDKAFRKMDKNKDGYVTLSDLQRVLVQLNYFLDEEQFLSLLKRLGLPTTKARLSYFDFLRAIDDGRASKFGKRRDRSDPREPVTWQSFEHLSLDKVVAKLKDKVTVNYDSLNSAFRAFDRGQSGLVKVSDFRRLLDNFCFRLTDKQFRAILTKCRITGGVGATGSSQEKSINWVVFLQNFSLIRDVKLKEWTDHVGQAAPPQAPLELGPEEVEERIREVVRARGNSLERAFADTDYAKIFVVSKEDFREILNENVMRLTDEQFDRVWAKQAVNEFNNLEYREFVKQYGSGPSTSAGAGASSQDKGQLTNGDGAAAANNVEAPNHACGDYTNLENEVPLSRPPTRMGTADSVAGRGAFPRAMTPLVNADGAEGRVKSLVYKHWQDIQRECRKIDSDGSGTVLPDEFVGILDRFGVILSLDDARQLMVKFGLSEKPGRFSYRGFLRHFILTLKPQDDGLLRRRKIHAAKLPVDTGKESDSFIEAMVRLKERMLHCWKEMRRTFRNIDASGQGNVTPVVFRQVLRQFAINLSEEEFFHLLTFYDHNMKGRVPYNDFIRAFLQ